MNHKQNKTCQVIDMSVPSGSSTSAKEFEKFSKYKDLEIENAKMWKMKTKTIPVFFIFIILTPIISHLNYIFIQILYKYFFTVFYKILYVQYLNNPNSPQ